MAVANLQAAFNQKQVATAAGKPRSGNADKLEHDTHKHDHDTIECEPAPGSLESSPDLISAFRLMLD